MYPKNPSKNLSKFMISLKKFSDYPFLIHKLPKTGDLPQVKKHCIRETSTITHTKFTNITSCSPYFKTFLLYKCTKIFHPLHTGFIPTLAKLYAKM